MDRVDVGGSAAPIRIEVAYSPLPRQVEVVALALPAGSTLAQALDASGLLPRHRLAPDALRCGVPPQCNAGFQKVPKPQPIGMAPPGTCWATSSSRRSARTGLVR